MANDKKDVKTSARQEFDGQDVIGKANPPAASFQKKLDAFGGIVYDVKPYQVKDYDSREPLTWDNGDPVMGLAVMFHDETSGSKMTYYVQGVEKRRNYGAALAAAGINGLAKGDYISITYIKNKKTGKGGTAKVYDITIKPGS